MERPTKSPWNPHETERLTSAAYLIVSVAADFVRANCPDGGLVVTVLLSHSPPTDQISLCFSGMGMISTTKSTDTMAHHNAAVFEAGRHTKPNMTTAGQK